MLVVVAVPPTYGLPCLGQVRRLYGGLSVQCTLYNHPLINWAGPSPCHGHGRWTGETETRRGGGQWVAGERPHLQHARGQGGRGEVRLAS